MKTTTKSELVPFLKEGIVQVIFEKADGSERVMNCTLMESHLPTVDEDSPKRKVNDEVLAVWDIDKGEWRSFRLDSVLEINLL